MVMTMANPGFAFADDFEQTIQSLNAEFNRTKSPDNIYGINGYDAALVKNMNTLLLAKGPAFISAEKMQIFNDSLKVSSVDIFPMLCQLLDLPVAGERDGKMVNISTILISAHKKPIKQQIQDLVKTALERDHSRPGLNQCITCGKP